MQNQSFSSQSFHYDLLLNAVTSMLHLHVVFMYVCMDVIMKDVFGMDSNSY